MRFIMLMICLLLVSCILAQYRFERIGVRDGLSQSSVNDILQDREGFMWFATQDGLNRYDGYDFTIYNTETDPPIAGNFTWSLAEDQHGNIWLASQSGATRLDWRSGKSTRFYYDKTNKVNSIYNQVSKIIIRENEVFVSFDGKGTYRILDNQYRDSLEVELGAKHVWYSKQDSLRNYLYNEFEINEHSVLISYQHLLIDGRLVPLPNNYEVNNFAGGYAQWKNGFYVGTSGGLLYYDFTESSFTQTCIKSTVNEIVFRPDEKQLLIGSQQGLLIFDPFTGKCVQQIVSGTSETDLTSPLVSTIYESENGMVWVGTANGGINLYNPQKDLFRYVNQTHGLSGKPVWSSLKYDNTLYIGADDGLFKVTLDSQAAQQTNWPGTLEKTRQLKSKVLNQRISALYRLGKDIYIGTTSGLLGRFVPEREQFAYVELPEKPAISSITERRDTLWVATHNALFRLDKAMNLIEKLTYYEAPEMYPTNYYLSSFKSRDGSLWFGSNTGFSIHHPNGQVENIMYNEHTPQLSPNHYFVTGFFEDSEGNVWMSTFGGGVSIFNRSSKTFTHLTRNDGLINNTCGAILGNETYVFVGTNGGLSVIEQQSKNIKNYTVKNGLLNDEFAIGSSFSDGQEFYFGVVDGLIMFDTQAIDNQESDPPKITSVEINYDKKPFDIITKGELNLYPSDRIFTLSFADLSYKNQDKVEYEYRLDGFNTEWVKTNAGNRSATYSLSPGTYSFQARSILNGQRSEPSLLIITKHPAFYETWWFLASGLLFGGLTVVLISRYFSHQALKERLRKLEIQQKIQDERQRISKDLHDNVGSQITYIATSIDNLSEKSTSNEIKELGEFTRDTMRQLRETIWVINRDLVTVEELKTKVLDYLSEILKPFPNIKHQVSFSDTTHTLNPTFAINLFRIIQEATNNILKHAKASNIKIEMSCSEEVQLAVEDDGVGFDGKDKAGHYGLFNMRSRAQEIDASLVVERKITGGTTIKVVGLKIGQMS